MNSVLREGEEVDQRKSGHTVEEDDLANRDATTHEAWSLKPAWRATPYRVIIYVIVTVK